MIEALGQRIRRIREKKGIKQKFLSEQIGVTSTATFSHWESGRIEPSLDKIEKLSELLGVSVQYLITGKELTKEEKEFILTQESVVHLDNLFDNHEFYFDGIRLNKEELKLFLNFLKEIKDIKLNK